MRSVHLFFPLGLLSAVVPVSAADRGTPLPLRTPDYAAAQRLLDRYSVGATAVTNAAETIGTIHAKGLKPTAANIDTVLRLLASTVDVETKVELIRLLGSLHTPSGATGSNELVARTVKGFVYSGDRKIALAAIQTYARIDYQPDRTQLLDDGLRNGILDEDSYCQELALFIPIEPPAAQYAAAQRLLGKNNAFGADVLAMTIGNTYVIKSIAPETRQLLLAYLQKQEPRMPPPIGEFGLIDGSRYAGWLAAVALLSEASGKASYADVVLAHLNDRRVDPRKILGFMTSAEGKRFVKRVGHRAPFGQAAANVALLAGQFPGHPFFAPLAEDVKATLGALPE